MLENRSTGLCATIVGIITWTGTTVGAVFSDASFSLQFSATCSLVQSATCGAHLQV